MTQIAAHIPTFILTPEGLIPTPYQVESLAAAVPHEPRGVYTAARTFHGDHALLLGAHLDRLEESARLVNIPATLDRARLRAALRSSISRSGYPDAKFRITIPADTPDHIYLALELLHPVPESVIQQGAQVSTTPLVRENPVAKTTDWMAVRQPTFSSLPPGIYEAMLVSSEGYLLEGLSSNFYGIVDGVLRTAPDGVLAGITRKAIFEIAPEILPLNLSALHRSEIPHLAEAMLTSSGRGVVPITQIDGQPVG
ncbi:MAG: aminotransferase class IV family protein, partial [Chloroflexi bacterium]|nr:aminotransferase class IV family protein [Chloroflexota bacterium]